MKNIIVLCVYGLVKYALLCTSRAVQRALENLRSSESLFELIQPLYAVTRRSWIAQDLRDYFSLKIKRNKYAIISEEGLVAPPPFG